MPVKMAVSSNLTGQHYVIERLHQGAHLRLVFAVSILLQSWLMQSCTRREAPPPALTQSTAVEPAHGDTAVPPAPQAPPVVMAFTDPSACAVFEQDGYPCSRIEQHGAPIGVEVHFTGRERHGLPLAVPGRNAREDWRGFDWLELELENRSAERLKLGLILRNEPGSWARGPGGRLHAHTRSRSPRHVARAAAASTVHHERLGVGARRRCRFLPGLGQRGFGAHPRGASDAVERRSIRGASASTAPSSSARSIGAAGWTATASARTGRGRAK